MKRVLLTGASGFIGKHLRRGLEASGSYEVAIVPKGLDLRERAEARRAFGDVGAVEYVIHAADVGGDARWSAAHPATQLMSNAAMALNVLDAWREQQPAARLVGLSSLWAYPAERVEVAEEDYWAGRMHPPIEHYGIAKKLLGVGIQAMRREHGMRGTMLVLGNVYGPDDPSTRVIPSLIRRMRERPPTLEVWGDGTETRDFVYVDDQIAAIERHLDYDGELLNITSGVYYSIRDVVSTLARVMGYTGQIVYSDQGPAAPSRRVSVGKATAATGWPATHSLRDLEQGLRLTIDSLEKES